jgi:predicted ATP-dependent endonuclease of OLD family
MIGRTYITGLSINNFRAFKQFDVDTFGQINLITGMNNSGKTSLLEALYLNLGPTNPTLWLNINARRGIDRVSPKESTINYLHHQMNVNVPIKFTMRTTTHGNHTLIIRTSSSPQREVSTNLELEHLFNNKAVVSSEPVDVITVEIEFKREDNEPEISKAMIMPDKIEFEGERKEFFPNSIFISTGGTVNLAEEAKRYDVLNRADQLDTFDNLLRIIEPGLKRTSLGIENNIAMVHGDVGYGLVPITLLGSGSKRLTSILLALTNAKDGVVLIDELENGFHFSVLEKIWLSMAELVENNGTQIFITSHSYECIRSALNAFEAHPSIDFRLHRLDKKTDRTELFTFNQEQLKAAIDTGWEVR